jgi:hypothetical protein
MQTRIMVWHPKFIQKLKNDGLGFKSYACIIVRVHFLHA